MDFNKDTSDIEKMVSRLHLGFNPLNELNTIELLKKIEEFKKIDLKLTSYNEISNQILNTISAMSVSSSIINESNLLYRVRKLKSNLSNRPSCIQDVWYPKAEYLTADGRANLRGCPMLYCAFDQMTPIIECGIEQDEWYAMIQYKVKANHKIQVYSLTNEQLPPGLTPQGEMNHRIINDFITTEFCKPVGKGTEYLYKISNVICANFLDMPNCDGYLYPSVGNYKKGVNVAIKPQAVDEHLDFSCVLICQRKELNQMDGVQFLLLHKANTIKDEKLIYTF